MLGVLGGFGGTEAALFVDNINDKADAKTSEFNKKKASDVHDRDVVRKKKQGQDGN